MIKEVNQPGKVTLKIISGNKNLTQEKYETILEGINQVHALTDLASIVRGSNTGEICQDVLFYNFVTIAEVMDKIKGVVHELQDDLNLSSKGINSSV